MSTELANVYQDDFDITGTTGSSSYSSMSMDTPEEKSAFFNAISDPDFKLADCINTVIKVRDIYCETVTVTNKDTGETSLAPRVVLVDVDGKSYQSVSTGIFNALRRLMQVYGPPTWPDGLAVKVMQKNIGKNRLYTLVCA